MYSSTVMVLLTLHCAAVVNQRHCINHLAVFIHLFLLERTTSVALNDLLTVATGRVAYLKSNQPCVLATDGVRTDHEVIVVSTVSIVH